MMEMMSCLASERFSIATSMASSSQRVSTTAAAIWGILLRYSFIMETFTQRGLAIDGMGTSTPKPSRKAFRAKSLVERRSEPDGVSARAGVRLTV